MNKKTVLITGSSGFIGYHLCQRLLTAGMRVIGVDNLSSYYDVTLKQCRQDILLGQANFSVYNKSIEAPGTMLQLFETFRPDYVVHLAAQAGVRYSIDNPRSYLESNIIGTFELLESAKAFPPKHMLLASTSSVFGANSLAPYVEAQKADHQISFYAATKKSTEVMAHSYAHLYDLPMTVFRFFTVYGPWGRPDMALYKFTRSILNGDPIDVYNHGEMKRDFTYVDDLVEAICLLMDTVPQRPRDGVVPEGDSLSPVAPHRIVNIGNAERIQLTHFISAIENATGMTANRRMMPMQPGDVPETWADTRLLKDLTGFKPRTSITEGIAHFVDWYRAYYTIE